MQANRFIIIISLIYSYSGYSQYALKDFDLDGNMLEWYDQSNAINNDEIFEGSIFNVARLSKISHQYFVDYIWAKGTIKFAGQTYQDIEMLYDCRLDLLLIKNTSAVSYYEPPIRINQDKIDEFNIHNSAFKNIKINAPPPGPGIYQILYEGENANIIIKRIKDYSIKTTEDSRTRGVYFYHEDKYFLWYGGTYTLIKNKKSFFTAFIEYKPQIKKHIKTNRLKIGKENDKDMKELIAYCDGLATSG